MGASRRGNAARWLHPRRIRKDRRRQLHAHLSCCGRLTFSGRAGLPKNVHRGESNDRYRPNSSPTQRGCRKRGARCTRPLHGCAEWRRRNSLARDTALPAITGSPRARCGCGISPEPTLATSSPAPAWTGTTMDGIFARLSPPAPQRCTWTCNSPAIASTTRIGSFRSLWIVTKDGGRWGRRSAVELCGLVCMIGGLPQVQLRGGRTSSGGWRITVRRPRL